jgi:hypothetical protein
MMGVFLSKIIEIIKWIMQMPGVLYGWMFSACWGQREDDYEFNDAIRRERQNSYGLSQIRNTNRVNHYLEANRLESKKKYSLVPVQPKQQDDVYKDRAERFIDRLPHDIQERIMEKFGLFNDPVRIIEASHNKGYIPQEYVILFAADETVDLGEKISLLKQLFNIVKIEQDKIIERVDFLTTKVDEQNQKIDNLTAQNQEIIEQNQQIQAQNQQIQAQNQEIMQMLGMQRQQSFVNTQASLCHY